MTIEQLRREYASGPVLFTQGQGNLPCLKVSTEVAEAVVYLHGAHVAHFQPRGEGEVLFMSGSSVFADCKPIRGGVPVCWPWFGAKGYDPAAPMHGFARLQEWTVASISMLPGGEIGITLELLPSDLSRKYWPHQFRLEHRIRIGRQLSMTLATRNTGTEPFTVNEALHTYFRVGDVREVRIDGLDGVKYLDKTQNMKQFAEGHGGIAITAETDRHYQETEAEVGIDDPSLGRRILISKSGSRSTVVWNPWIAKAKAMPDFGDEEWSGMLCVETANAGACAASVAANSERAMTAVIRVEKR